VLNSDPPAADFNRPRVFVGPTSADVTLTSGGGGAIGCLTCVHCSCRCGRCIN